MQKAVLKPLVKRVRRKKGEKKLSGFNIIDKVTLPLIIKAICSFLLSGTSLIGGATPLGFACAASVFDGFDGYICFASSILGIVFYGGGLLNAGKYIIASILFSLIYERFLPEKSKESTACAALASLSLLFSGAFLLFATMSIGGFPLIYDAVILIVECATLWVSVLAFKTAIPLVFSLHVRRSLSTEQTVSLALFAGGTICGLGGFGIDGVFSVTGIFCVFFVLCFATRFGSLHGCASGIIMGLVSCLSRGRIDACAASFAISGLCAGYFSKRGKWASCISFIMANAVITILSNGSTEVLINIFDTFVAALLLYLIPQKTFDALNNVAGLSHPSAALAASTLLHIGGSLNKCEKSFQKITTLHSSDESNRIMLYKRTAHKVCSSCGLRKYCWGRDSASTLNSLDSLTAKIAENEAVSPEFAPTHCLRAEKFIEEFCRMYEIYKNDCVWSSRTKEFQSAVYTSFRGISNLILKTADNVSKMPECDMVASDNIKLRLKKEGILVKDVFVCGREKETQIRVSLESCGGFGRCESAVQKVLNDALGMPFVRTGLRNCGNCSFLYVVKPEFSISTATFGAMKANKSSSGDYAVYALVDRHTYAIILCDGRGSGETAREESRTCASLIMRLLESGLDPQSAINIINSMLLCASSSSIAAIDLCLISLDDGACRLYKCGAAGTYTKIDGKVTYIDASSLPAGAVVEGDTDCFCIPSGKGSMIVLVSDGVAALESEKQSWISGVIKEYSGTEPATLAQLILERAKTGSGSSIKDDITVVAAYIG